MIWNPWKALKQLQQTAQFWEQEAKIAKNQLSLYDQEHNKRADIFKEEVKNSEMFWNGHYAAQLDLAKNLVLKLKSERNDYMMQLETEKTRVKNAQAKIAELTSTIEGLIAKLNSAYTLIGHLEEKDKM